MPATSRCSEAKDSFSVTLLDINNSFMVFNEVIEDVFGIVIEWGSLYVLSCESKLSAIVEKDLNSKLSILFKKNLYDVSIRIAKSQQYDADGLMEIFRQYGDYLFSKSEYEGAVNQYIKTIGQLEPSYVIKKYLNSQQVQHLTTYLQALHKEGKASEDHTTLLLNCFIKLNEPDLLKQFLMTKDREVDFDVEVAIDVCRHVSTTDALLLAEKHDLHDWYLTIQIEDSKKYSAALDYIGKLDFEEAEQLIKKYGVTLLEHIPHETTQFLKRFCTDYRPSNKPLVDSNMLEGYVNVPVQKACPEEFIHYFLNNSQMLVEFLEHLIQTSSHWSSQVYSTLLEHYLEVWGAEKDSTCKQQYEQKVISLLESPKSTCDKAQALILCKEANFTPGLLYLYEQHKMYQSILKYHISQKDYGSVLVCCRRFGPQDPTLWVQALWSLSAFQDLPTKLLDEILDVIGKEGLLSPLLVVNVLSHGPIVEVEDVKGYLNKVLQEEATLMEEHQALIDQYTEEITKVQEMVNHLQTKSMVFQSSRCSICNKPLELPSVHFLCQHSYHQHCIQDFSDNEAECLECLHANKTFLEALKSQEDSRDLHESFHSQLDRSHDSFVLVSEFLGRGVFASLTSFNQMSLHAAAMKKKLSSQMLPLSKSTYSNGKEDKFQYGQPPRKPLSVNEMDMDPAMWMLNDYQATLNESLQSSRHIPSSNKVTSADRITSSFSPVVKASSTSSNPFEDDQAASTNPFEEYMADDEDDDYDKKLNPFED